MLPIIDFRFSVAAPVLVQERHQAGVDVVHIREDATTKLKERGDNIEKLIVNMNHFPNPKFSVEWNSRPSRPAHAPPNPEPSESTGSSYDSMKVEAPGLPPVFPTWFHPVHADYRMMGTHASLPKSGPSNPSTESESGQRLVVEEPQSPTKGSSTVSRPWEVEMTPGQAAHAIKHDVVDRSRI